MSIIESNADVKEVDTGNQKIKIPDLHLQSAAKHGKSNSQAVNSSLYASKNQMISKKAAAGGSTDRAQKKNIVTEPDSHERHSLQNSISQSNSGFRNKSQHVKTEVGRSIATDDSASLLQSVEHQIRIEISKTEVLDSMKKEHQKDLSLLYYDFNNSKARLMSKMKKISDFVIQEENVEADGDGAMAAPNEDQNLRKKQPTVLTKDKSCLSPVSKKQQSPIVSEKTKSTLTKVARHQTESNKKSDTDHFATAAMVSASKASNNFITSQPAVEASTAIKLLDLPPSSFKNAGKLSTTDVTQIQTEMDFVNKKIDKAKQSISQLQNEGGLKGMNL